MKTCVNCGNHPVEDHHYKGIYASQLGGGGRNLKTWDWMKSELCRPCHRGLHDLTGQFKNLDKEGFSRIQFIFAIQTIENKIERGDWKVKDKVWTNCWKTNNALFRTIKMIEGQIKRGEIVIND